MDDFRLAIAGSISPADPFGGARDADRNRVLYGIGDVHGMDDLLGRLLAEIEADAAAHGLASTLVFLGDVVNRGPQSRQVVERLLAGPARAGDRWVVLRGNHEQAMLDALAGGDERAFRRWLRIGGTQTLASYGHTGKRPTLRQAAALIGARHLAFLADLPVLHVSGDCLFVHAGVEPGVALRKQDPQTLLTIRKRFLKKPHGLPFTVVHGHTPTEGAPLLGPGRIGVDTGACVTGILTAIAIEPDRGVHRFLHARAQGAAPHAGQPAAGQ